MSGWLWVGVFFIGVALFAAGYIVGRKHGGDWGWIIGFWEGRATLAGELKASKTLPTYPDPEQHSARFPDRPVSRDEKHGGTGNGDHEHQWIYGGGVLENADLWCQCGAISKGPAPAMVYRPYPGLSDGHTSSAPESDKR